ncbi:MAG: SUF system NifU family Fe-S cluster assembly protein [Verrucomicrobiales bacterium]|nr:SUF system NifU family Fe-S cluster assembly protein [Verrucomicrobiales bacterium]
MSDELNDLYQQVILDHSRSPRNFRRIEHANRLARGHNPLCGDQLTLFLQTEGDVIRDIAFQGDGCAISRASASLLTEALKGRRQSEVRALFDRVHTLVTTGGGDAEDLGKLAVFAGVHRFPARVKCALLAWHAALAAVEGQNQPVSTETPAD